MKHTCIIANREKDRELAVSRQLLRMFSQHGVEAMLCEQEPQPDGFHYTDPKKLPEDLDFAVTVGGDGTLIQAARDLMHRDLPIIGVNMGTLGYLTELDVKNLEQAVRKLSENTYFVEEHIMLAGRILRDGAVVAENVALNDAVLGRNGHMHVICFDVYVDSQLLTEYNADGMILSTPTGSTAYNLSAGGPLIVPNASMFVMTPVCAHTLNSRSVVLPDTSKVTIAIKGEDSAASIVFDGAVTVPLQTGDRIEISKARSTTKLIKLSHTSFFEVLRSKMK